MNKYKEIKVNNSVFQNVVNMLNGVYYPLKGFLRKKDFFSVLDRMRLDDNSLWSIPIVLDIDENKKKELIYEKKVLLKNKNGKGKAILKNIEIYNFDKNEYAKKIFGTTQENHPGVWRILRMKKYLIGGDIIGKEAPNKIFPKYNYTPKETKNIFQNKGWKTIVGFQTRNIPHRSHEYLQKKALQKIQGLFIQPIIGEKKEGDFKNSVILNSYKILLKKYYPENKIFLGILPMDMHYAGPREAVIHALIRRNYGCTHIIIGRDHAGVGNYYDSMAAHNIFDNFNKKELGIKILKYQNVSYCVECNCLVEDFSCEHKKEKKYLSGTKIRKILKDKKKLPKEFIRPEISKFLSDHSNPFVG